MSKQEDLFKTKTVLAKPGSGKLFDEKFIANNGPVVCLGQKFKNDAARREHFTGLLREKLKDPEFRKIEGFPVGEDEDILALSDPPYYTACPNPWIGDFIDEWEKEKITKKNAEEEPYHREPFAADVSEGKNDPIYNAHSYHTKVPHKAIMRYILHYTEPGDIVFDGFCGTGMTGIAAQMCGEKDAVESLGVTKQSPDQKYKVEKDGTILERQINEEGKSVWEPFSKLGARKAVLNDLSPAATFIAYNYNTPVDVSAFEREAKRILAEVEEKCGWMYGTTHTDGKTKGKINYTVWSDVFICNECAEEIVFWEEAVDTEAGCVKDAFSCPHCNALLTKKSIERAWITVYKKGKQNTVKLAKQIPVVIDYSIGKKRFRKKPDKEDFDLIRKINDIEIGHWYPQNRIIKGDKTSDPLRIGVVSIDDFYTKRNMFCSSLFSNLVPSPRYLALVTAVTSDISKMARVKVGYYFNGGGGPFIPGLSGTLYIPSLSVEKRVQFAIENRIATFTRALSKINAINCLINTTSTTDLKLIPNNSLDYLFFDPPFGSNIMYSELNMLWESWLRIKTEQKPEAIVNNTQKKKLGDYRQLMVSSFEEAYRVLKPGRWMTVEFSNTKASVWNSIQTAITEAGFIVANVSALDKKQGSFNAVTNTTSVKQDLVISAYKPNNGFEERFVNEAQTEEGVWDFIRTHLKYLPVIKKQGVNIVVVPERDPRILFDQVVAYFMRKNFPVPISSQEFQLGLSQRFSERDGMYFLPEQVAEYDRKKMTGGGRPIQQSLFVSDEASAIGWLRNLLRDKPQSFQDINPLFMKEISGWSKNEKPLELSTLLEQNFLCYDGKSSVPEQIHGYLSSNWKDMRNLHKDDTALIAKAKDRWYVPDPNKAGDLEKLREKSLMKEFEEYKASKKKLKLFRLEAVRAGFKKCWQEKDYLTIINVAEKIPNKILEEDPKLLMWYDDAVTRNQG